LVIDLWILSPIGWMDYSIARGKVDAKSRRTSKNS
jgi:hypothetical protein